MSDIRIEKLASAIRTIKRECSDNLNCETCRLYNPNTGCMMELQPTDWDDTIDEVD